MPEPSDLPQAGDGRTTDAPHVPLRETLRRDLIVGLRTGLRTFWELARVMVPAYGVTLILERLGVIPWLAQGARPLMSPLVLPGDAAVPLVAVYVLNICAAVGSMQALRLSGAPTAVLAVAILIGHDLLVEGAALHKVSMNGFAFAVLRIVAGLAAAAVANPLIGLL